MTRRPDVLGRLFERADGAGDYARLYLERVVELHRAVDHERVGELARLLDETSRAGRCAFFAGNGGCAALAAHFVNDLVPVARAAGHPPVRAMALGDNPAVITALANDHGFEHVFTEQLRASLQAGDVVVAMSVSGDSPNLVAAVRWAKDHGARTVGLCGFEGGRLGEECELVIHVPSARDEYGPVQDVMAAVMHAVTGYLAMHRGLSLSHGG